MKTTFRSQNFKPPKNPVVALGVFDGVHRGHQALFQRAVARAKKIGGTAVAYTFDPHPAAILAPSVAPPTINSLAQKIELVGNQGIGQIVVEKFTKPFSRQTPEKFFSEVILGRLKARELFVGYNFTFGIHRSGNTKHLVAFGQKAGIKVHVMDSFLLGENLVSSTQVRQLLARGDLAKAGELLARPYFIEGTVIRGRGIGGRELGIHTANLKSENDLLLPTGVYITYTIVGQKKYRSVTNIGPNPTFGRGPLSIESHLFNFRKNIVGKKIRIIFLKKIRDEITFASPKDLAAQIQNDIKVAMRHFKNVTEVVIANLI